MELLHKLTDYVFEREFTLKYVQNKLNIMNYLDIVHFSSDVIRLTYGLGQVVISGKKMVVNRLMNEELYISGEIHKIEFVMSS